MTVYAVVKTLCEGRDSENLRIEQLGLKVGDKFEVEYISMGQSSTKVTLKDFTEDCFSSVFFRFEEDGKDLDIFKDERFNPYLNIFKKK